MFSVKNIALPLDTSKDRVLDIASPEKVEMKAWMARAFILVDEVWLYRLEPLRWVMCKKVERQNFELLE